MEIMFCYFYGQFISGTYPDVCAPLQKQKFLKHEAVFPDKTNTFWNFFWLRTKTIVCVPKLSGASCLIPTWDKPKDGNGTVNRSETLGFLSNTSQAVWQWQERLRALFSALCSSHCTPSTVIPVTGLVISPVCHKYADNTVISSFSHKHRCEFSSGDSHRSCWAECRGETSLKEEQFSEWEHDPEWPRAQISLPQNPKTGTKTFNCCPQGSIAERQTNSRLCCSR